MAGTEATATAVVCAAFDEHGDAALDRLRDRAAALGLHVRRAHRPHLTLGAARVTPGDDLDALVGVAHAVADRHRSFDVEFGKIGTFAKGVLWLGPRPGCDLEQLQRDVDTSLSAAGWLPAFGRLTDPSEWIPHCTIATRIPSSRLGEARQALRRCDAPVRVRVSALTVLLVGGQGDVAVLPLRDSSPASRR